MERTAKVLPAIATRMHAHHMRQFPLDARRRQRELPVPGAGCITPIIMRCISDHLHLTGIFNCRSHWWSVKPQGARHSTKLGRFLRLLPTYCSIMKRSKIRPPLFEFTLAVVETFDTIAVS